MADIEAICTLQDTWAKEDITHGFVNAKKQEIEMTIGPYLLVAEIDGKVVGYLQAEIEVSSQTAILDKDEQFREN